jgi:hypothetical protein
MKLFSSTFKLYAYKNKDCCDLSIKVNDEFVMTFKLTHKEFVNMINDYAIIDPDKDRYGVQFTSQAGQFWFIMDKKHFEAVRITVSSNGIDYNFRINYEDWEDLKNQYIDQMNSVQPWDNK